VPLLNTILFGLIFLTTTHALDCTEQWHCSNVTEAYNFVECKNGVCACRKDLGFDGNATIESPCSCKDKTVVYMDFQPVCRPLFSKSCTEQWQCNMPGQSVTLDFNFVECRNKTCICREDQGFIGLATRDDPCRCGANKTIHWLNGTAFCADIPALARLNETIADPNTAKQCEFQWQCGDVTETYPAMDCIAGRCTCRADLGFTGNGNTTHPCRCLAPRHIEWIQNIPFCVEFVLGQL
jgi:hypothetical protein